MEIARLVAQSTTLQKLNLSRTNRMTIGGFVFTFLSLVYVLFSSPSPLAENHIGDRGAAAVLAASGTKPSLVIDLSGTRHTPMHAHLS